eukprot:CAMPEP_0204013606 /NCGR_PEP_ID=MMETSP0360-20130528/24822_1 /ASSEMBLY_ACC=CAM_ASM_000342 /TAXON_ID=268821 /ORGANISM="Scrippsiella Hangoei, Strain SHTV-5" /LENGTH=79 /DNA_ID=CAMNT_0050956377 /DNA_START=207 /DNA_END=443 /DNA_ORIENTATION=-
MAGALPKPRSGREEMSSANTNTKMLPVSQFAATSIRSSGDTEAVITPMSAASNVSCKRPKTSSTLPAAEMTTACRSWFG